MNNITNRVYVFSEVSIVFFSCIVFLLFYSELSLDIKLSFILLSVSVVYSFLLHLLSGKESLAFCVINIFFFCFYIVAPIIQLNNNEHFLLNTMPVIESELLEVNLYLSLFIFVFSSSYYYFSLGSDFNLFEVKKAFFSTAPHVDRKELKIFLIICLIGLVFSSGFLFDQFYNKILVYRVDEHREISSVYGLISSKVIGVLPLIGFIFSLHFHRRKKGFIFVSFIFLLILVLFKNPIMERRNALGTLYLTLIFFTSFSFLSNARKSYYYLLGILVLCFPILSVFTHYSFSKLQESNIFELLVNEITGHFTNMHYDAWAGSVGILNYVEKNGVQLGSQLSAAFTFFIPRSMWEEKPNSTGTVLGDYLMGNYNLWFNNISATFPMEGYIDFGILGLVIYAILFSFLIIFLEKKSTKSSVWFIFYVYFSFFCFFIFRGPFSVAFAYVIGSFVGIVLFSKLLKLRSSGV